MLEALGLLASLCEVLKQENKIFEEQSPFSLTGLTFSIFPSCKEHPCLSPKVLEHQF